MAKNYNRKTEDLGNLIGLEHVNVTTPDQRLATLFYIVGMGFTRDPYLVTGVVNMWVNIGRSQFHLPIGDPQVVRGRVGLVVPDLDSLAQSLDQVRGELDGTRFSFTKGNKYIDVTCPWGNAIRCHAPDARYGPILLGMPYVEFDVPAGTAEGIERFYSEILEAHTQLADRDGAPAAHVSAGYGQSLIYRETDAPLPDYDGHHLQVYVVNFSRPHEKLKERGLISEESNQYQYRFLDIVDPAGGDKLYTLEHEIRSMTHPLFGRQPINRNPAQTNNAFAPGYEDRPWAMPYSD